MAPMKIGFSSIYSWRPHVEHLFYLSQLMRGAGHQISFLSCESDLSGCYSKELHPARSNAMDCMRCRIGNIRSYTGRAVYSIGELARSGSAWSAGAHEGSQSSASTLGRFESDEDFSSAEFQAIVDRLESGSQRAYAAAAEWIKRERLDAICVFNGRIDATRALIEAARDANIPFVTMERTWFGDGLQLLPGENCLGLDNVNRLMEQWADRPLTRQQALRAVQHVAARFLRRNDKEWRAYNTSAKTVEWPEVAAASRILLVPGSRNEVWGHPDWGSGWQEQTEAYDALIEHFGLRPSELVLRCHPNWGERIGAADGRKAEDYYTGWAKRRGVHCIASTDRASTLGLIERCDAIVVAGGSAALEAGILGKQVIATGPSIYQKAGFQSDAYRPEQLAQLTLNARQDAEFRAGEAVRIARQTLRFAYTMAYRVAQFVDHVHSATTTRYEYRHGADASRLERLLRGGMLEADDQTCAEDAREEDAVLALIGDRQWERLYALPKTAPARDESYAVKRRWMFRPIDALREALPRGDR